MKTRLSKLLAAQLIVWNVGQGQWVTEVSATDCVHYDLGGEKDVSIQVFRLCRQKPNYLFLSHWDWDHISFASSFAAKIRSACLVKMPEGAATTYKKKQIARIPMCADSIPRAVSPRIESLRNEIVFSPVATKKSRPNDLSQVVVSKIFQTLIPGDSTTTQEKKWASMMPQIRGLILGHHGSRTSTSEELLKTLPNLKWSVASARFSRYGHPHQQTLQRLQKNKTPVLRTEDWGHLHFLKN